MHGHNIFVSYKYDDRSVGSSEQVRNGRSSNDYLSYLHRKIDKTDEYIFYGERPDDDLSYLKDEEIDRILKDKMFPTSITIVLVSPRMKEWFTPEERQWIPQEIRYSLRNKTRTVGRSYMNAIIAVVLPGMSENYDYAFRRDWNGNFTVNRDAFFDIMYKNMYSRIDPEPEMYSKYQSQTGTDSYIPVQTWDYFIRHFRQSMDLILEIRSNWTNYDIVKRI